MNLNVVSLPAIILAVSPPSTPHLPFKHTSAGNSGKIEISDAYTHCLVLLLLLVIIVVVVVVLSVISCLPFHDAENLHAAVIYIHTNMFAPPNIHQTLPQ